MAMNILQKHNRVLIKQLVKTDFKLRYQDSVLGFAWSMLNPLFMFLLLYIVFDKFFGMGRMAGVEHFPVQLLLGIVMWNFFAEATTLGMNSIVSNGGILRKINFPKYIIVITSTISSLINLGISIILVLIFSLFNGVGFTWRIILLPLPLIEMYIFALAFAFILGTLFVKFRDIGHIWGIITQGWFYATPIIYQLVMVVQFSPLASRLLMMLPPAQMIQDARWALISPTLGDVAICKSDVNPATCAPDVPGFIQMMPGTPTIWNYIGNPMMQAVPFLIIAILAVFAVFYFKRNARYFAEEL
jgi:ABC-2 type transport system permease protein